MKNCSRKRPWNKYRIPKNSLRKIIKNWGRRDLNPHDQYKSTDFKSVVSTIPPRPLKNKIRRRHPDLNWGMKDLQSKALPLGYTALLHEKL